MSCCDNAETQTPEVARVTCPHDVDPEVQIPLHPTDRFVEDGWICPSDPERQLSLRTQTLLWQADTLDLKVRLYWRPLEQDEVFLVLMPGRVLNFTVWEFEAFLEGVRQASVLVNPESIDDALSRRPDGHDQDVALAKASGLTSSMLASWGDRFSVLDVVVLRDAGISPASADRWPERFRGIDIVALERAGTDAEGETAPITPSEAAVWPERFGGSEIVAMHSAAIEPEHALEYPRRFTGTDIELLCGGGISASLAAAFPTWCLSPHISAAIKRRISPDEVAQLANGDWGDPDPTAMEAIDKLSDLFGPELLPISRLDRIRPLPADWWLLRGWLH